MSGQTKKLNSRKKKIKRDGLDIRVMLNPESAGNNKDKDKDIVQTTEISDWI